MPKKLIALLFAGVLTGCATYRSPDAVVAVSSSPQGADIYLNGQRVGKTPDLIKTKRKRYQEIEVRNGTESRTIPLEGTYRYRDSFWPDFAFLSLAPVAWIVDISSGAAWDYLPHYEVSFDGQKAKRVKPERMKLAIAPPRSEYSILSDELGVKLEAQLRAAYPEYDILPYKGTVKNFAYNNFDYDRSKKATPWPDVFYDSGADVVFASHVDDRASDTLVAGQIFNAYADEPAGEKDFRFADKQLSTIKTVDGYESRPVYFYVLPNTITVDVQESTMNITMDEKNYESSYQSSDDFLGQVSRYASVIGFRRYQSPTQETMSHWQLSFNPSLLLSRSKQKFEESSELRDLDFTVSHIDFGYGPQYMFSVRKWQLFASLQGAVGYERIEVENGVSNKTYDAGQLGLNIELGATYFFTPRWSVRFATRSVTSNDDIWEKAIQDGTGVQHDVSGSTVLTSGFSIGYTFSDYIHPGRRQ